MTEIYPPTERTTATRNRKKMAYDRAKAHAILDEAFDCAVGFVVDGEPRVLPNLHVRLDDTLYLHGSSGGRMGLSARGEGIPLCVSVTLLDGLVYARSQFNHSANYRSVVVHGDARLVTDEAEKARVLTAIAEKIGPGRAADSRPGDRRELAQTSVLALPLVEVSVRERTGGVIDEPEDMDLPYWAGVLPLRTVAGPPVAEPGVTQAPPAYLPGSPSAWQTPVVLEGRHVRLEPLTPGHAPALFEALDDEEVWKHIPFPRPSGPDGLAADIAGVLRGQWLGSRSGWAQVDPVTGEVMGMTTYHDIDTDLKAVGIGHTMLGRRWWRTGVNTEAKLLLLERAFDVLGAERVFWYTDIRNERSQRAIARLGASRDGVIRRQRLRPDGTWRDTVLFAMTADEWPAAAQRLRDRMEA
ncbi:RimJ/RimL family protein N-acetyltransferase/nitroimidazol reductase NimA-like FMN-containing flavoprotein (pyridoxamine 5'-phosphate oxidase superfamily) [Actinoplanes lutulentus]|uniref:RimJ/RimL family protein N-acetyltransferase n=1 Tax=Actinoplanes lutulentus TaxID=1287878 RepID=A0A327Z7S7_9ACTN|nr:bifunctional pyridoxamine 5'-phosphate oxidase family protein/GNAT family N-acetyltransferase [Actinoplanes lutulentus]MBB2942316.1 RimJ/RimL family protein N-acetyltransferase/nitroimidazol reductase NimA-like FMN-containing flavoprotein (pyridoxamine 5'-phosphate oxidase superfamily) [Actinoplanes lutulentus]RAK33086.1 RimJ/RimL family protein N-acetyltransferase [Actinoplanes lutulentus]